MTNTNTNTKDEWYKDFDTIKYPDKSPISYEHIDIVDALKLNKQIINMLFAIGFVAAIFIVILFLFKTSGMSIGHFFKNLKDHMFIVGKSGKHMSTKTIIVPNK